MFRDVVCLGEVHPVDLDVAADGSIWIAGYAYDGLQTMHALQPVCGGSTDLFLAHYASGTMRPLMVTCIGGRGGDGAIGMALAPDGEPVVVGQTSSPDLPLVRPIQRTIGGVGGEFGYPSDAIIVRLDVTRRWLEYSTLLGGQHWDPTQAGIRYATIVGEDRGLLVDNLIVQIMKFNGRPIGLQFPPNVEVTVTSTEPGRRRARPRQSARSSASPPAWSKWA